MKTKNLKLYKLILITILTIIVAVTLSVTYAYIRQTKTQSGTNTLGTLTCLDLSLTDETSAISLTNALAVDDSEGLISTPYTFTITNNCTAPVSLKINLESLNVTDKLDISYLKYSINEENTSKTAKDLSSATAATATISGATSKKIKSLVLKSEEEKTYELRLWVKSTTTFEQGGNKNYQGKIVVTADALNYNLNAPSSWSSADSGTLLAAIRDNGYNFWPAQTIPGSAISEGDESVVASTQDDYGTSYYFRGSFDNNYVEFANKCWRIVRVDGANNIKLLLANDNPNGLANPCSASNLTNNSGYARYSGSTFTTQFNTSYNDNTYLGFMYGTAGSSTYAETHANINKSKILENLEAWYKLSSNHIKDYESYLADVIWCNDKSTSTSNNLGYGTNYTTYRFTNRQSSPTLVCPNDQNGGNLSKFTVEEQGTNGSLGNGALTYKIGLLTADEIAFAGGKSNVNNTNYYIIENATTQWWWALSPSNYYGSYARVWIVYPAGGLSYGSVDNSYGLRPSLSLVSTVPVETGGQGTTENPLVISNS